MENQLRAALIAWLRGDPALTAQLNAVEEESPLTATVPWLGIAASASTDWSTKDMVGREIRVAFELQTHGDGVAQDMALVEMVEGRLAALPRDHGSFMLVTTQFLRARAERRVRNLRSVLLEYRFRILAVN